MWSRARPIIKILLWMARPVASPSVVTRVESPQILKYPLFVATFETIRPFISLYLWALQLRPGGNLFSTDGFTRVRLLVSVCYRKCDFP